MSGGVYVYRTRKPSSLIGLARIPFRYCVAATITVGTVFILTGGPWWLSLGYLFMTGRHFAYVGETVSFADRHGEHMRGGGRWKKGAASWSDLDAVCVARLPLPKKKWLLRFVEGFLIKTLFPVYNEKGNKLNLRRISRASARRMRQRRDNRRVKLNVLNFRPGHMAVCVIVGIIVISVWG